MTARRTSVQGSGAVDRSATNWQGTIMWPCTDVGSAAVAALRRASIECRTQRRDSTHMIVAGDATITLSAGATPGGEVAKFILGSTAMIRSRLKARDAALGDKLCARVNSLTQALTSILSSNPEEGGRVARALLAHSRGLILTREAVLAPNGDVVMDLPGRRIEAGALRVYRAAIVARRQLQPLALAGLGIESWRSAEVPAGTGLLGAESISHQLGRYADFAEYASLRPRVTGPAARQVELAAYIESANSILAAEVESPTGMSAAMLDELHRITSSTDGLFVDEYGVYRGDGAVVFAPWTSRFAPMPPTS